MGGFQPNSHIYITEIWKTRVDSRLRECDNYAFLAVLAPNFKFPAWLLPQNAEIWRNSSKPLRIFGPSVCILFHSFNFVNFRRSRPLLVDHFYFHFYKNGSPIREMKCRNSNDSVQTGIQEPKTTD